MTPYPEVRVNNMACPFLDEEPVAIDALIIKKTFHVGKKLRDRQDPLAYPDSVLIQRYRFSRDGIIHICNVLGPHIESVTRRSRALTTTQSVCIALRFFASGRFFYTVGDAENLVKSTVSRSIRKVYLALKTFLNDYIVFPTQSPRVQAVKDAFHAIAGFPNVVGALDCAHFHIKAPSGPGAGAFQNRKGSHSLNVQMVCDASCVITNVETKWPGSIHDSKVFRKCELYQELEKGEPDRILVGDRAFACTRFLMTPFLNPDPGPQTQYNEALTKTRAPIDITIGQLKERFQCLKMLRVAPDRARDIIVACAVLHNIAIMRKEKAPDVVVQPEDDLEPLHTDIHLGVADRERIVSQYFS